MLKVGTKIKIVKKDKFLRGLDIKEPLTFVEKSILEDAENICGRFAKIINSYIQAHLQMYEVKIKGKVYTIYEKDIEHVF